MNASSLTLMPATDAFAVLRRQVEGIDAWHTRRRREQESQQDPDAGREARVDHRWRVDVLRREHCAIVARSDAHLRSSGQLVAHDRPRAVVVHRHTWAASALASALEGLGVDVVTTLDNGADAVGAVVVEQPEILVLSEVLPMLSSCEVVREVRALAPATVGAVLLEHLSRRDELLRAGARLTLSHSTPWRTAAEKVLATTVSGRDSGPV